MAKARNKDSLRALAKLTEVCDGELRIAGWPPLLVPVDELAGREGLDPSGWAATSPSPASGRRRSAAPR